MSFGARCPETQGTDETEFGKEAHMRGYEDRYTRDMRRHDLALRMIRYEVRTHTIRVWTGLTQERIRRLCRTYGADGSGRQARRHRGPAPRRLAGMLQSPGLRNEAAAIGGLCYALEVLPNRPLAHAVRELPGLARGERLCYAFELYRSLIPDSPIDLEHLILLVTVLAQADEVVLGHCCHCDAAILVDRLGGRRRVCSHCRRSSDRRDPKEAQAHGASDPSCDERVTGLQRSLF
jgi:hypothetical protein